MALVHFNRLFVSEPCLYIKIMSEWEGKEAGGPRGASEGFHSPQIETPSAGQAPRTEARQLDPSMLKSELFVHQVRDMGSSHRLQGVEDAPHPRRSNDDTSNACKMPGFTNHLTDPHGSLRGQPPDEEMPELSLQPGQPDPQNQQS